MVILEPTPNEGTLDLGQSRKDGPKGKVAKSLSNYTISKKKSVHLGERDK